jgi:hypothetical protein
MDPASTIRDSIAEVALLRARATADTRLGIAVTAVKRLQAARFRRCYADLLESKVFGAASRFFLEELYGEADYAERDHQFARIAGTLATVFPASVVGTAVDLAHLHALTEELDHQMASDYLVHTQGPVLPDAASYLAAWHSVGRQSDRQHQLVTVLALGNQLADLTRKPGLAMLLKLMRRPASRAGMGSLQHFLERGFETFATLSRTKGKVAEFLSTIEQRESEWLDGMFDDSPNGQAVALAQLRA